MSKETQKIYKKQIDEATKKIRMNISSAALKITDDVYHDLLVSVRDDINRSLELQEQANNNQYE